MQLIINQLVPIPLKEGIVNRKSDIWGQRLEWGNGQLVFIQAPSGTGKTTLIHTLYRMRTDHTGEVLWSGTTMKNDEQIADLRSQKVSIIFQDLRIFPELTAWENLEVKRLLTNTIPQKLVKDWMEELGIAKLTNAKCATMSYGEQQRLVIIRSLLQPFDWLLMDEPFSHLDNANKQIAAKLIANEVQKRGSSFLLADLDENNLFAYTHKYML